MKVRLKPETIGIEILKAKQAINNKRAQEYNRKKDEEYYKYCLNIGDKILIEYAKRKLLTP